VSSAFAPGRSLLSASIVERGRWEGDEVVVDLSPGLIGAAVEAGDDVRT